ncbi:MAG: putative bifunctional diguanylate cyclase/phosphodiesterase [Vulcanococcus sp.]
MSVAWAEFLLLPGDGLLLISEGGTLQWADPVAQDRLQAVLPTLEQQGLTAAWPALQERIQALESQLESGPQELELALPQGGDPVPLRLFQSDTGLGIALLQSSDDSRIASEQPLAALLGSMLNTIQDSLLITLAEPLDAPGPLIVYANDAVLHQTGYRREELLGRSPRLFQGPDTDPHTTRRFGEALRRWLPAHMEVLNYSSNGRPYWIELKVAPLADADGWVSHWVSVQRDVSERREGEIALTAQALSDPLTGLPNRRGFTETLERALNLTDRHLALIFCDLDRFKEVNDRHGHAAGDALLLELSHRLQSVLRGNDTLARLGGDEFVVLMQHLKEDSDALMLAERLRACLREPWRCGEEEIWLSMSMGVATCGSQEAIHAEELLRRADLTMYRVKEGGRDGVAIYDLAVEREVQQVVGLRHEIEQGLRHHRLQLDYQPQVDLRDGRIVGAEALVRLHNVEGKRLSPASFIPLAERTGLIVPVEQWVLGEALDCLASWQRQGRHLHLAVNISPQHLERGNLVQELLLEQQRSGADLRDLTVEITETVVLQKQQQAEALLLELKAAGVRVALDDFGTGYSSLAWLSRLPVDAVKLDQSYVMQMAEDERCITLVRGFVRVFQEMGLEVVAEGIETELQRRLLLEMGCTIGQGYLFSRPVPLSAAPWS